MTRKTENWKVYGRVNVTRNPRGRFVTWHKVRVSLGRGFAVGYGKYVAIYGTTRNRKGEVKHNRIELRGSGKQLYRAIKRFHEGIIPKRPYTRKSVEDLTSNDVEIGEWLDIEVKS